MKRGFWEDNWPSNYIGFPRFWWYFKTPKSSRNQFGPWYIEKLKNSTSFLLKVDMLFCMDIRFFKNLIHQHLKLYLVPIVYQNGETPPLPLPWVLALFCNQNALWGLSIIWNVCESGSWKTLSHAKQHVNLQ